MFRLLTLILILAATFGIRHGVAQTPERTFQNTAKLTGAESLVTPLNSGEVVAEVNGRSVTRAQLDALTLGALRDLEERAYDLRRGALERLVNNIVLEAEADRRSLSVSELIAALTVTPPVSDQEIEEAIQGQYQLPGTPDFQVREQFRSSLEQRRKQEAFRLAIRELRASFEVAILLQHPVVTTEPIADLDDPSLGPEDAPITIVEFSDFQCPYCASVQSTIKDLLAKHGSAVRLVYKHFPLAIHPDAPTAAEAAECAQELGAFWPYHDRLFALRGGLSLETLKETAKQVGMNQQAFDTCLDSGRKALLVEEDHRLGVELGVTGTPTFFINGQILRGAQPFEELDATVKQILAVMGTTLESKGRREKNHN